MLLSYTTNNKIQKKSPIFCGGEFWTDGYYISTISEKGNKTVIINYIKNQGREKDIRQLKLFEL